MGTNTATIETLTAEVRVLMVGSRQVTLSVARQLDRVRLADMEPFGRIKLDRDDDRHCLIGKHRETGVLVLASGPKLLEPFGERPSSDAGGGISGVMLKKIWAEWDSQAQVREYVKSLPLIVLAGLK